MINYVLIWQSFLTRNGNFYHSLEGSNVEVVYVWDVRPQWQRLRNVWKFSCLQNPINFRVFHCAQSCTPNTSSVFQSNAHLYLIHIFIFIISLLHVSTCYIRHLQGESRNFVKIRRLCASDTRFSLKMACITYRNKKERCDKNKNMYESQEWNEGNT
jgi:hypothetical protein